MKKPRILYVDDEPLNLLLLKANLSKQYEVLTAPDGIAGLEVLKNNRDIKVVFSDMKMPHMSGIEFIRQATALAPENHYYIVTGFDINAEIQKALDEGLIRKYFSKPFNPDEIANEIRHSLQIS
ncbi:response regulator [Maribellus sp. YY47]|uniref:response regulator n=1 Tax=Maribellus sp. YY47 TaxID=2929486 RepID=UPI002001A215|nr:response regulator [Maribellus sp. YY47]MCK3683435.1 response regulator [Maribellus sp. YY47]